MTPAEFITIRKAANLSQADLSAMLGKSRSSVARYEGGKITIPHLVERYMKELERENGNDTHQ